MTAPRDVFESRWQAAVTNLRLATEVMQATADELPLDIGWASDRGFHRHPLDLLHHHVAAFHNYTTALTCVQALLQQRDHDGWAGC